MITIFSSGIILIVYVTGVITILRVDHELSFNLGRIVYTLVTVRPVKTFMALLGGACLGIWGGLKKLGERELKFEDKSVDKLGRKLVPAIGSKNYGEGHFLEPSEYDELAIVQDVNDAYGPILGKYKTINGRDMVINLKLDRLKGGNNNIAVFAGSGSGKSAFAAMIYIFQAVKRRESIIITDPKGELYGKAAEYLKSKGYVVKQLNLKDLDKSDGWNCLQNIDPRDIYDGSQTFADIIINNVTDEPNEFHALASKLILQALILRVYLGDDFTNDPSNLPPEAQENPVAYLQGLKADKALFGPDNIIGIKNMRSVYTLLQTEAGNALFDVLFDPDVLKRVHAEEARGIWNSYKQASEKLRGNIPTNLATLLQIFGNPRVSKLLSTDDIDFDLPGEKPCAYFCIFPDSRSTYNVIVAMFFSLLFITLYDNADATRAKKLDVPVNFLLDEFPSIGYIPDFGSKVATVRSRGINICMISQDVILLEGKYDKIIRSILSNCSTWMCLGTTNLETAKLFSERIEAMTVQDKTEQHRPGASVFSGESYSTKEGKRDFLTPAEIMNMDRDKVLLLLDNKGPIVADKYFYFEHPEYKNLPRLEGEDEPFELNPTFDLPDFGSEEQKKMHEENMDYALEYIKEHPLPTQKERKYKGMCEPYYQDESYGSLADKMKKLVKEKLHSGSRDSMSAVPVVESYDDLGDVVDISSLTDSDPNDPSNSILSFHEQLQERDVEIEVVEEEGERPAVQKDKPHGAAGTLDTLSEEQSQQLLDDLAGNPPSVQKNEKKDQDDNKEKSVEQDEVVDMKPEHAEEKQVEEEVYVKDKEQEKTEKKNRLKENMQDVLVNDDDSDEMVEEEQSEDAEKQDSPFSKVSSDNVGKKYPVMPDKRKRREKMQVTK